MGKQKISTMADGGRKSGRAVFDNQGRASWEWQTATGVFQTDVTNEQLQRPGSRGPRPLVESEPTTVSGRVWTGSATGSSQHHRAARERLLRRLAIRQCSSASCAGCRAEARPHRLTILSRVG